MAINMSIAISNMRQLMAKKITYSMTGSRTGADGTGDCSGTVYASLNKAGAKLPIGNTDSMFTDLPKVGFQKVTGAHKYGDIFVWGRQGMSSGAAGHTGIFLDDKTMINCNAGYNGVRINDYNAIWNAAGRPYQTFFRAGNQGEGGEGGAGSADAVIGTNNKVNMDNSGAIEEMSYIGDRLCFKGWHYASNPTKESSGGDGSGNGGGGEPGMGFKVNWNSMQSRAQFFVSICTELGYPKNTTLALLANANTESSIDPSALEPNGMGHGYFQWSYAYNWGQVPQHMKRTYNDAKFQIQWAKQNRSQWINVGGYATWDAFWRGDGSPQSLTNAWVRCWERPAQIGDRWGQLKRTINVNDLKFVKLDTTSKKKATFSVNKFETDETKTDNNQSYSKEFIEIRDATTDKLLKREQVGMVQRPDLKKENPDVEGIEWSGFDFCMKFENPNPFYVKFTRQLDDGSVKTLEVKNLFFPHSSSRTNIGHDYSNDCGFLVMITDAKGKTEFITDMLSGFSYSLRANEVPHCTITIPIADVDKFDGHMDCRIIYDGKMFDGIVKDINLDKDKETASIQIDHKISEWEDRQIPSNYTVKNRTFPDVFSQSPFLYSTDWYIDCDGTAQKEKINYAFSRQDHLEALTKAVSLTHDLFWRVGTRYDRYLEIGKFGRSSGYVLSDRGDTEKHIKLLGNVEVKRDFSNVFNILTVYGEKSDSSQANVTLRDAYLAQQAKGKPLIDGFPIVILNPTINNEQKKYYTNITKVASNNSLEYAIIDTFGLDLEHGKMIEKTASFNDVAPFEKEDQAISDEERAQQSMIAYKAGVRRLQYSGRRREVITAHVGHLPEDINVLDKVWFDYNNCIQLYDGLSRRCKTVYQQSGEFYLEEINVDYDENLMETNTVTLSKELHRDDDTY